MRLEDQERVIVGEVACVRGVDVEQLIVAIEAESPAALSSALGISLEQARSCLRPIVQATALGDDWGAGCRLLTDELRADLHSALRRLAGDHSASFGVSHG